MQDFIWGIILGTMGVFSMSWARKAARNQGLAMGIFLVVWGLFSLTFGMLHIAAGAGHRLLSAEFQGMAFCIIAIVALIGLVIVAVMKKRP